MQSAPEIRAIINAHAHIVKAHMVTGAAPLVSSLVCRFTQQPSLFVSLSV